MKEATKRYHRWLQREDLDDELKAELLSLKTEDEIYDRFYKTLDFGTGGLRGILGVGTNRMNIYTVRESTQGLANYINQNHKKSQNPSVAIAYDSRINSELFAMEAAKVLMGNQIKVYLYPQLMPTPALSYAVRHYGCAAGIMVTASHNPAKYNGYKVYNEEGCQITLEAAAAVLAQIEKVDLFEDVKIGEGTLELIPEEVTNAFLTAVEEESTGVKEYSDLSVVYTPLNGTGNLPVRKILERIGVKQITMVKEQELPDGNFTTCPYPNPEKKEALELGLALCEKLCQEASLQKELLKPDLLLATDPDCDRVGIAVRHENKSLGIESFQLMTGNEVGILLLDFLCQRRIAAKNVDLHDIEQGGHQEKRHGARTMPENPVAIKTIVSSAMADDVAKYYGITMINVLTGFKFIGEQIGILEKKGEENRFIFGFEESYGYLSGSYVRDKDAVNASMLICEMVSYYKGKGQTLVDRMEALYQQHGYYKNDLMDFAFEGAVGMEQMEHIMKSLRANPPQFVIGRKIVEIADYQTSQRRILGNSRRCDLAAGMKPIALPKSDVLEYILADGSGFIVRPSGTEPKLKVYLSAKGDTKKDSEEIINQLKEEITKLILI